MHFLKYLNKKYPNPSKHIRFPKFKYLIFLKIYKVACVKRAVQDRVPILDPKWQQNATLEQVERIFRSDGTSPIPLVKERHVSLNQLGKFIVEELNGDVTN